MQVVLLQKLPEGQAGEVVEGWHVSLSSVLELETYILFQSKKGDLRLAALFKDVSHCYDEQVIFT